MEDNIKLPEIFKEIPVIHDEYLNEIIIAKYLREPYFHSAVSAIKIILESQKINNNELFIAVALANQLIKEELNEINT